MNQHRFPRLPLTSGILAVLALAAMVAPPLAPDSVPAVPVAAAAPDALDAARGHALAQEPTYRGIYFDEQQNSTSGSWEAFASGTDLRFMRLWEDNLDYLTVAAPYDVTPNNQLRLCYKSYHVNSGDPLNTRFWTTSASGWIYLDPASYAGIYFAGSWVTDMQYIGPEGTGTWTRLDPPQGPYPIEFGTLDVEFNPFANRSFPGCGGAGLGPSEPTVTPTFESGDRRGPPTQTPTPTRTRTPTPTATRTLTATPTPCVQGVRGFILDADTTWPIRGILVRVGDRSMTTDVDSGYMIEVPQPGGYLVFAGQTRDYIGNSESASVPPCQWVNQNVYLRRVATPTPTAPPEPYYILLLTNASNGLYLGTEGSLRGRTRCSFEGGGTGCSSSDVVTYQRLLGPFQTQSEARAALCRAITERRNFPLGIGLKGRWQGSETWYGLWDSSVTFSCS